MGGLANIDQIRQAVSESPWDNRFVNIRRVQLFIQTIQNIISNYISHETITCDDREESKRKYNSRLSDKLLDD